MAEALQEEPQQNTPHDREDNISHSLKQRRGSVDKDAQEMVIGSLRAQIQDLFSQVSQLNNKLVESYDRVSDLEDDIHVASANLRTSSIKISQLELERTQHLSALNTGLLVEKSHVTAELNRLMEKATEEAAQRGQAESARMAIEKDLDDLSATLFGQANTMVAEARFAKHLSERKVEDAERALKSAEEAVQLMQAQMQAMQAEREETEKKAQDMEVMMGKGKRVDKRDGNAVVSLRLLSTHAPFQDYLSFLAHLRLLHPTSPNPPAMSTLLPLPFLARLLTEDSEPTVRLDLAPSLNWLSRRSVLAAIHSGQLTIEPISAASLFAESSTHATTSISGVNSSNDNISCALCGAPVFQVSEHSHPSRPPVHPLSHTYNHSNTWSGAFFKKTSLGLNSNGNSQPPSPTRTSSRDSIGAYLNSQVYIFRLASPPTSAISSLTIPSLQKSSSQSTFSPVSTSSSYNASALHSQTGSPNNQPTTIYPLCMSGWCLARLRTTCTLWAFVRTGIVEKVWEEELAPPPPPPPTIPLERTSSGEKPPIPPRKRGLWGIASAFGERAVSWSEGDKEKGKRLSASASASTTATPPPSHPSSTQPTHSPRRLPPPLSPVSTPAPASAPKPASSAPPLPKRSEGRSRQPTATAPSTPPRTSTDDPSTTDPASSSEPAARPSTDLPSVPPLSPSRGTHLRSSSQGQRQGAPTIPARTHTPSNVPLPESRPQTPTPAVPSRTSSPAAVGGAPPPLPRRAAARARVATGGLSRPETPANADVDATAILVPAAAEKEAEKIVADTPAEDAAKAQEEVEKAKDEEVEANGHEGANEKPNDLPPDRSTQASPAGSDVFVDAPTDDPVAKHVQDGPKDLEEKEDKVGEEKEEKDTKTVVDEPIAANGNADAALDIVAEDGLPAVNGSGEDAEKPAVDGDLKDVGPEAEVVPVNGVHEEKAEAEPEKTQEEKDEEEREEREKEAKEKACYVGDATWEEKTWKEIVRLREDMFWARIGGFRD